MVMYLGEEKVSGIFMACKVNLFTEAPWSLDSLLLVECDIHNFATAGALL